VRCMDYFKSFYGWNVPIDLLVNVFRNSICCIVDLRAPYFDKLFEENIPLPFLEEKYSSISAVAISILLLVTSCYFLKIFLMV